MFMYLGPVLEEGVTISEHEMACSLIKFTCMIHYEVTR